MGSKARGLARQKAARAEQSNQWWTYAVECARQIRAGSPPPALTVHGLVMGHGERPIVEGTAEYSRYWAGDGTYYRTSSFAIGSPALVLGSIAGTMIANSNAKRAAERNATLMWREHQPIRFLVTNHRVLCHTATKGWLSFYFNAVTEFHPDLHGWSLVLAFQDTAPLALSGPAAPALALWCGHGILGERWVTDPRMAPLLS
ncbi:hypothetical protein [Prescottella agglutinans]|uniref:Uncharacterized protein n=1 Tax=Prescottella agglutinans TaxID=1644129 RepID=A0ABT6M474_9NOCA|nr:hypothetical protein [Prescottella agglutinans]MDH6279112.1 hypothetical protein [Prescottella agglutinans]